MEEFFDKETIPSIYSASKKIHRWDMQYFEVSSKEYDLRTKMLFARFRWLCDMLIDKSIDISSFDSDIRDVFHLTELNIGGLLQRPMPKEMREIDMERYHPISRNYINHYLDMVEAGFYRRRDEDEFYKAITRLAREGYPVKFPVKIYEHSKKILYGG